jgi:hypothetical protein
VIVSPGLSIFTNAFTQLIPIVLVLLTFSWVFSRKEA